MAANKPLVSVLMTVYNRQDYITEAIQSIVDSTFTDWELVIVDDGSTDESYKLAKESEEKDTRIRLYRNEKNLGQFQNRNRAASYARGKYLKFVDSDDLIYKHSLEIMVEAMQKFPDAAFAFQHQERDDYLPYPILLNPIEAFKEHFLSKNGLFNCGPSGVIFRTETFLDEGGFLTNNYTGNDTELLIRLGLKYSCVKLQPSLVWWRRHENQAFNKATTSGEYLYKEMEMQLSFLRGQHQDFEDLNEEAITYLKWKTSRKILIELKKMKFIKAHKLFYKLPISFYDLIRGLGPHHFSQ